MSLASKTLRSAGYMFATGNLNIAISFIGNLLLARILLPDDFGIYAFASSILSLIFMFGGFGSQEAIIQNRDDTLVHFIPTAFWVSFFIAFCLALLGSLIGMVLVNHYNPLVSQFVIILVLMHFFTAVGNAYSSILERQINFKGIAFLQLGNVFFSFLVAVIVALIGFGAWALIIRELVSAIISVIGFILLSRYSVIFVFDWKSAQAIWTFGWKLMVSRISEVVFGRFDNFVIGSVLGTMTLGHYSMAYRLSFLGHQFTQGAIQPVVLSAFSAMQNSPAQLQYAFDRLMYWMIRASALTGLGVVVLGKELVQLLYGSDWALAGLIFQNMWLFLAILPIHEAIRHVLIGAGCINSVVVSRVIMLLFFVPTLILTVVIGDIILVTWAVNLSLLLSTALMFYHVRRIVAVRWLYLLPNPMISAISTILVVGVLRTLFAIEMHFLATLGYGVFTVFLYCITLILLEYTSIRAEFETISSKLKQGGASSRKKIV